MILSRRRRALLPGAALCIALSSAAFAGKETVLYTFHGFPARDGANPLAVPVMDDKGDLYGTASAGGGSGCGMVYKLHRRQDETWKETSLYSFSCGNDGDGPWGGVVFDKAGNLYGNTVLGGAGACLYGCGVVYKLTPAKQGDWTETVLYSFPAPPQGSEYGGPYAGLTFDGNGKLYGTTVLDDACGDSNYGSVFRLKRVNEIWKEHDIRRFCGTDGADPSRGPLVLDAAGNLYGTTTFGGADGDGVVFEMSPLGGDKWAFNKLHEFTNAEGGILAGGVTIDASGDLYGAEYAGGSAGHGAIYELSPSGGAWNESILHVFNAAEGENPFASPVFDVGGNLFGTTQAGGSTQYCINCGVIYELVSQGSGQWSESIVYSFGSQPGIADGSDPVAGLMRAPDGNFYGTAAEGGDSSCNCGVVFQFTP